MTLQPGESYTVQVAVTNQSLYLGEPVAAALTIEIEAALNGVVLIPHETFEDWFEPGEAKAYVWTLGVPVEMGISSGAVAVEVRDPNNRKIAQASAPIEVAEEGEEPEPKPEPELEPELRLRESTIYPGNYHIDGRLLGLDPTPQILWTRTFVHRPNGTKYGWSGNVGWGDSWRYVHVTVSDESSKGPDYWPPTHISCEIYDYQGGTLLAHKIIEDPMGG